MDADKKPFQFTIIDLAWAAALIGAAIALESIMHRVWEGYRFMENPILTFWWFVVGSLYFAGICAPIKRKTYGAVAGALTMALLYLYAHG